MVVAPLVIGFDSGLGPRKEAKVFAALVAEGERAGVDEGAELNTLNEDAPGPGVGAAAAGFGGAVKEKGLEVVLVLIPPKLPKPPKPPNFGAGRGSAGVYTEKLWPHTARYEQ